MATDHGPEENDRHRAVYLSRAARIASVLESCGMLLPGVSAHALVTPEHEAMEGLTDGLDVDFNEALTAYVEVCNETQACSCFLVCML